MIEHISAPAFQFYAADYLADETISLMSLEEEGCFVRLLANCWRQGSIPADMKKLERLCKGASTTVIEAALQMFIESEPGSGRLIYPMLELQREKHAEWRKKSKEGGEKSAEVRKAKRLLKGSLTTVESLVEPPSERLLTDGTNQTPTLHTSNCILHTSNKTNDSCPSGDGRVSAPVDDFQLKLLPEVVKRDVDAEFAEFWAEFPRKDNSKKKAREKFGTQVKSTKLFNAVMEGLRAWKVHPAKQEFHKWPYGVTWLDQARWEDQLPPVAPVAPAAPSAAANPLVRRNAWGEEEDFWEGQYWFSYYTINDKKEPWLKTPEGLAWSRWEAWKETQSHPQMQPKPVDHGGPDEEMPDDEPEPEPEPEYDLTDADFEGGWQPPPPRSRAPERRGSMTSMAEVAAAMMAKIGGAA